MNNSKIRNNTKFYFYIKISMLYLSVNQGDKLLDICKELSFNMKKSKLPNKFRSITNYCNRLLYNSYVGEIKINYP